MLRRLLRAWRRRSWARRAFPAPWLPHLERLGFYRRLTPALKSRFRDLLKLFVWERYFFGAAGLEVTDQMKVTIAAAAVRLVLFLDLTYYDDLTEIVIYPYRAFHHPKDDEALLGEAHRFGTVVLSWPAVLAGMADEHDGHDTALHEFAHVLDKEGGTFDGTPRLRRRRDYRSWARVMSGCFLRLREGEPPESLILRDYGAKNEAEFFAVATEAFFERPDELRAMVPDLYGELARFYGHDPAASGLANDGPAGHSNP